MEDVRQQPLPDSLDESIVLSNTVIVNIDTVVRMSSKHTFRQSTTQLVLYSKRESYDSLYPALDDDNEHY